jgi:hypothetical protein
MSTDSKHTPDYEWLPATAAPEGVEVMTKIDDGNGVRNVQSLTRRGNLWFYPDMSMYVYYTPTHYAEI